MNRPKLYEMLDDLYIDLGTPPFNVWEKELEDRGIRIEVVVQKDIAIGSIRSVVSFAVSRMCTIMDDNPDHVIVPNPGDPGHGHENESSVILVPEELADKILVLGEIVPHGGR